MKKTIWEIEIWLLYHIMMVPGWDMISETLTFFWHYTLNDITGMGYALHPIGYSGAYFTTNHTPIIRHIHTMKKKYLAVWPNSQIPQCISPISHNALFCNRNVHMCAHFCHKMVHCGIFGSIPFLVISLQQFFRISWLHSWCMQNFVMITSLQFRLQWKKFAIYWNYDGWS